MPENHGSKEPDEDKNSGQKPYRKAISRRVLVASAVVFVVSVSGLAYVAHHYVGGSSYRISFFAESSLNLLILFAVIVHAYIYVRQWDAMERSLKVAEDTLAETKRVFDMTERPIVIATNAILPGFDEQYTEGKRLQPQVSFRNCGRTAAQKVKVTTEVAAKPTMVYPWGPPITDRQPQGDWFLGAGEGTTIQAAPADAVSFEIEFFKGIWAGKECMLIHGKGSYEDLAGREWPIEYSFKHHPEGHGFIPHSHPKISDKEKKAG
jgi:hypothetical protein